jgi:hypothetical protein
MTEPKRNPNPFIRAAQEAKAAKEKKFEIIPGATDKVDQVGKAPKLSTVPRATKVMRKAGRGR